MMKNMKLFKCLEVISTMLQFLKKFKVKYEISFELKSFSEQF